MTEAQVLEQLDFFEKAILKYKDDKKALKAEISELNENLVNFKSKTAGTIKHLVEDVIEKKEADLEELKKLYTDTTNNLNLQINTAKNELIYANEIIDYLYTERSGIDAKDVSFEEKENFLRNDFKIRLADVKKIQDEANDALSKNHNLESQIEELNGEHEKEIKKLNDEIESLKEKASELNQNGVALADYKKRVDDLINQNNETKKAAEKEKEDLTLEISNLKVSLIEQRTKFEEEKLKFDDSTKVETERLKATIKSLEATKEELENEKAELLEKIKRLEAEKSAQVQPRVIENRAESEDASLDKDVHSFRFGRTTKAIILKASHFIEALYSNCTETDTYFELNKPEIAAEMAQITEKEMNAFMKQMGIVKYAGQPLIYEFEGRWRSSISMRKMIDFIKEEI